MVAPKSSSPGYGIVANPDGTVTRLSVPKVPPNSDFSHGVASKDVTLNPSTGVWARIFLPQSQLQQLDVKFPVVLYFHGGGFVMMSVAFKVYHKSLHKLCKTGSVIVVAVEYRLAPEHRLPAAHEDAYDSFNWLQARALEQGSSGTQIEPWLASFADFSRCFFMGDSSGGNMVYHLALRVCQSQLAPLRVQGLIIVQPFFGGQLRTATELRLENDEHVPLAGTDWLWRTALPKGADRDHPIANPFGPASRHCKAFSLPTTLVIVASKDPMQDRQLQCYATLKEAGVEAQLLQYEGSHGFQMQDGPTSASFIRDVVAFLRMGRLSKL